MGKHEPLLPEPHICAVTGDVDVMTLMMISRQHMHCNEVSAKWKIELSSACIYRTKKSVFCIYLGIYCVF